MMPHCIRVLVVDDNATFRNLVCALITAEPSLQVAGTASDGLEAVEKFAHTSADLVLMDVTMPHMNGFDATRILKRLPAPPRVVIVSSLSYGEMWRDTGADAFIEKPRLALELTEVLRLLFSAEDAGPLRCSELIVA